MGEEKKLCLLRIKAIKLARSTPVFGPVCSALQTTPPSLNLQVAVDILAILVPVVVTSCHHRRGPVVWSVVPLLEAVLWVCDGRLLPYSVLSLSFCSTVDLMLQLGG